MYFSLADVKVTCKRDLYPCSYFRDKKTEPRIIFSLGQPEAGGAVRIRAEFTKAIQVINTV